MVREHVVRILANPVFLHGAVVLVCASFAFCLGMVFVRLLRKSIQAEADISVDAPAFETMPMHVYNTVIQQLKQQKEELKLQSETEQQRARASESFHQTVLANLSCGVLAIGKNGLVKSSNPAAKVILGFASPAGMSVEDIFRGAVVGGQASERPCSDASCPDESQKLICISDEVEAVLRAGTVRGEIATEYETPAGANRSLSITICPVLATDGAVLGVTCLIDDISELMSLRGRLDRRPAEFARQTAVEDGKGTSSLVPSGQ
jgi:nitrogen fixation/metabolism regulation signal transduction histidine kinase